MDVKRGYKQTKAGVLPEDWEVKTLGNIALITTGNTPPTRDPANYGDEFLFVSPGDMGFTKYITHTERMLSRKGFSISRAFPPESILFVCIGSTIGKCGIARDALTSNQQISAILPTAGTSSHFLYYAVSSVAAKVKSLAGEQAVPIVNKSAFSDTPIPLPPTKAEQEAIAHALSDSDALIESMEQLLTKKRQLKQGAMQELLTGRRRLPGFEINRGSKQTEVGVIPEDWQLRPMLTVVRVASGQFDPKMEPYRSMTLVAPDHIESGSGRLLKAETAGDQRAISGKYLFSKGDIVYSKIRPYLRKAILADGSVPYSFLEERIFRRILM